MIQSHIRLILIVIFLASSHAKAALLDLNLFYISDSLTTATTASYGKTFYALCAALNIDHKGSYLVGWNYATYSSSEAVGSATTTYTSTQMGPKFLVFLNKDHNWLLGLAYNILTSANDQAGSAPAEIWRGTAYSADFGYHQMVSESLMLGLRLNYSTSSYSEKLIGTAYSTISYSRTFIYPSMAISFIF